MSSHPSQRRRSPRLKTRLRVQIVGVDEALHEIEGDVSVGGLYMDTAREIGALGSVQRLRLTTVKALPGQQPLSLLARIARIATSSDFWRGQVIEGVAFEFMFQEIGQADGSLEAIAIEKSPAMGELVRALAREAEAHEAQLDHVWQAKLDSSVGAERAATVNGVSLQGTVLETDFPLPTGELIRVDIPGPGPDERIPLFGRAIDCQPIPGTDNRRYRTTVSFTTAPTTPTPAAPHAVTDEARRSGGSIQEALGALLSVTASAPPNAGAPRRQHLAGDLARVSLASVLTVCELERATGVLRLCGQGDEVLCYLGEGRLQDVEQVGAEGELTPLNALAPVLEWAGGSFEFLFEPVARPDRIGMSVGAVLLTLAHAIDEANRG